MLHFIKNISLLLCLFSFPLFGSDAGKKDNGEGWEWTKTLKYKIQGYDPKECTVDFTGIHQKMKEYNDLLRSVCSFGDEKKLGSNLTFLQWSVVSVVKKNEKILVSNISPPTKHQEIFVSGQNLHDINLTCHECYKYYTKVSQQITPKKKPIQIEKSQYVDFIGIENSDLPSVTCEEACESLDTLSQYFTRWTDVANRFFPTGIEENNSKGVKYSKAKVVQPFILSARLREKFLQSDIIDRYIDRYKALFKDGINNKLFVGWLKKLSDILENSDTSAERLYDLFLEPESKHIRERAYDSEQKLLFYIDDLLSGCVESTAINEIVSQVKGTRKYILASLKDPSQQVRKRTLIDASNYSTDEEDKNKLEAISNSINELSDRLWTETQGFDELGRNNALKMLRKISDWVDDNNSSTNLPSKVCTPSTEFTGLFQGLKILLGKDAGLQKIILVLNIHNSYDSCYSCAPSLAQEFSREGGFVQTLKKVLSQDLGTEVFFDLVSSCSTVRSGEAYGGNLPPSDAPVDLTEEQEALKMKWTTTELSPELGRTSGTLPVYYQYSFEHFATEEEESFESPVAAVSQQTADSLTNTQEANSAQGKEEEPSPPPASS